MADQPKTGRQLHGLASDAREHGDFLKSLQLIDEAILVYIQEKDYVGLSEIEGMASLTYRHLYRTTQDKAYLFLAQAHATAGIEIAKYQNLNEALALPTFDLAKVQEELGTLGEASESYQDAVAAFMAKPPASHNRPGVLADMKVHMYTCMYKAGDKSALPKALDAIAELEKSDEKTVSKYNYDVWLSGAHMRVANILKDQDKDLAQKHLDLATQIINSNPDLKLRKEQLNSLSQSLK